MKNGKLYSIFSRHSGSFIYEPIAPVENNPLATIRHLCNIDDRIFYFVDDGVPLPLSPDDEFAEVTSEQDFAKLRLALSNVVGGLDYLPTELDKLRITQKDLVRDAYETYAVQPVTTPHGVFDGGFDSAIKLDAAMRLNQAAGLDSVNFFDSENSKHELDFDQALLVTIIVAGSFQKALAHKQKLFKDIEDCNNEHDMRTIVWSEPI